MPKKAGATRSGRNYIGPQTTARGSGRAVGRGGRGRATARGGRTATRELARQNSSSTSSDSEDSVVVTASEARLSLSSPGRRTLHPHRTNRAGLSEATQKQVVEDIESSWGIEAIGTRVGGVPEFIRITVAESQSTDIYGEDKSKFRIQVENKIRHWVANPEVYRAVVSSYNILPREYRKIQQQVISDSEDDELPNPQENVVYKQAEKTVPTTTTRVVSTTKAKAVPTRKPTSKPAPIQISSPNLAVRAPTASTRTMTDPVPDGTSELSSCQFVLCITNLTATTLFLCTFPVEISVSTLTDGWNNFGPFRIYKLDSIEGYDSNMLYKGISIQFRHCDPQDVFGGGDEGDTEHETDMIEAWVHTHSSVLVKTPCDDYSERKLRTSLENLMRAPEIIAHRSAGNRFKKACEENPQLFWQYYHLRFPAKWELSATVLNDPKDSSKKLQVELFPWDVDLAFLNEKEKIQEIFDSATGLKKPAILRFKMMKYRVAWRVALLNESFDDIAILKKAPKKKSQLLEALEKNLNRMNISGKK